MATTKKTKLRTEITRLRDLEIAATGSTTLPPTKLTTAAEDLRRLVSDEPDEPVRKDEERPVTVRHITSQGATTMSTKKVLSPLERLRKAQAVQLKAAKQTDAQVCAATQAISHLTDIAKLSRSLFSLAKRTDYHGDGSEVVPYDFEQLTEMAQALARDFKDAKARHLECAKKIAAEAKRLLKETQKLEQAEARKLETEADGPAAAGK